MVELKGKGKTEDRQLLEMWQVCTCALCGNMGRDIDFMLWGVEAHKKDKSRQIIKICAACESDWIATYQRRGNE